MRHRLRVPRHVASLVTTLLALPICAAGAQSSGVVRGVVYDSILGAPLAGAEVRLEGHARLAVTDGQGTFRIDSVPAGAYTITFGHASLDSLGLGAPFGRIDVRAGDSTSVRLTTPSLRGIAMRLCPDTRLDSSGVLVGAVRDAASSRPIAGVRVAALWQDWDVLDKQIVRRIRTAVATSDAGGRYVACGVPNDGLVELQATAAAIDSSTQRPSGRALVDLRGRMVTWRDVSLGVRAVAAGATRADAATILLDVIDDGGRPVADAQARVSGDSTFRTASSDGRLRIVGAAPGSQTLEVRALGFEPATISFDLKAGQEASQAVTLTRATGTLLDAVRIVGLRSQFWDKDGFEARRRNGNGYFFGLDDLARRRPFNVSDMMRYVPGLRLIKRGFATYVVSNRNTGMGAATGGCRMAIIVDGIVLDTGSGSAASPPVSLDDIVTPGEVRGIEIYPGNNGVPPKYGVRGCGAVILWTRLGA